MYLNGTRLREIERVIEIHHTTIMHWIRQAEHQLSDALESEKVPEVTDTNSLNFGYTLFTRLFLRAF